MPKVYRAIGTALEALQVAMSHENAILNDYTLASIAALSPVEAIRIGHTFLVPMHLDGITTLLVSRASLAPLSELAHRILEYHFCDTFVMASIRGVPSSLESVDRIWCESCVTTTPVSERRLRSIGNELCVRLPRLIVLTRDVLRTAEPLTVSSALSLAEELQQLKNDDAELQFVRQVGIDVPLSPADIKVSSYTLQHRTISSFEAGAYYWMTRISILRLCRRLRLCVGTHSSIYAIPSIHELEHQLARCVSYVLMTAQFARTARARKRRRLSGCMLLASWGAVRDCPAVFASIINLYELQSWILNNANKALLPHNGPLTRHDMDEAADLFVGGPLTGVYKALYDAR